MMADMVLSISVSLSNKSRQRKPRFEISYFGLARHPVGLKDPD
jgi:hypothetical protein